MHRIAGIVIASSALMRYGRIVVSVRQGADVPYQRERQQEQKPDGNNRCAGPQPNGRPRGARLFLQRPRPADGLQYVHEDLSLVSRGSGRNPPGESQRSAPGLRIVSDELWQAAHGAWTPAGRSTYGENNGQPGAKREAGLESKYLRSGFLRWEACGGNMIVTKRTGPRGKPQLAYVYATHRARPLACPVRSGSPAGD